LNNNAIIFSEGVFGKLDGKTTHGLVRYSQKYRIIGIIDSSKKGLDAGEVLDGKPNGIKIYGSLQEALNEIKEPVKYFIYGVAPNSPFLPREHRKVIFEAIHNRINIVIGLMNFLSQDKHIREEAKKYGVEITDVRKPPTMRKMHIFTNQIAKVDVPVIAVLGTDTAVGKRTTAIILHMALREKGIKSEFVATGQTGLMQGAKYGIAIDAIPGDFLPGEVEHAVVSAYENEHPDIIIVEGQSALLHPAFIGSYAIMKGARPDGVFLAHAPGRKSYCDYPEIPILDIQHEIKLVETIANSITFGRYQKPFTPKKRTLGIAINHENMTEREVKEKIKEYEMRFEIPATDPLLFGVEKFVNKLQETFFQQRKTKKHKTKAVL
jgi:uncharacterized NAD-dependent epimerase/dehydratase family protein